MVNRAAAETLKRWTARVWMSLANSIATFRRQVCQLCDRSEALHDHRHPLAAADTHGLQAEGPVPRLQVIDEGRHDTDAGHPERVAERDRAAMRVEPIHVPVQLPGYRQHLQGERLVELYDLPVTAAHPH